MANVTSIKVIARIFTLALTVFKILTFKSVDLDNLGNGRRVQYEQ